MTRIPETKWTSTLDHLGISSWKLLLCPQNTLHVEVKRHSHTPPIKNQDGSLWGNFLLKNWVVQGRVRKDKRTVRIQNSLTWGVFKCCCLGVAAGVGVWVNNPESCMWQKQRSGSEYSHGFKGSKRAVSGFLHRHSDTLAASCPLSAWVAVIKGPEVPLLLSRTPLLCP